ncbi:MAG: response regulator [Candidatus Sumerlaeota bacterium]
MAKILVIDDNPEILALHELMLEDCGHTVETVQESEESFEKIRAFQPDLLILDILMPGVTGGTIYHAVRDTAGKNMPIIVSSASQMALKENHDPMLKHCPKPVEYKELMAVIENMLHRAKAGSNSS